MLTQAELNRQAQRQRLSRQMTKVDPNYQGPTTLQSVIAEETAKEFMKDARRRAALMDDPAQRRKQFFFWNRSLDEINDGGDAFTNGYDDIGLPQMTEAEMETDSSKVHARVKGVVAEFLTNLERRRGILLTFNAKTKVCWYAVVQCLHGVRIDAQSLEIIFDRLNDDLQALIPEDLFIDPSLIVKEAPVPAPKPTIAERIETLNLETDEGRAKARTLVENDYYENVVGPIWRKWNDWLYETYDLTLTPKEKEYIIKVLIPRQGWSFHDERTWDRVRYYLCTHKHGDGFSRWTWDKLSKDEQRALKLESIEEPLERMTPREKHRLLHPDEF
jgi:hypothetical protein